MIYIVKEQMGANHLRAALPEKIRRLKDADGLMEKELILQAKTGNRAAFELLVKEYLQRIYRAAYSLVRNVEDASDIAQEAFMRAYRSIGTFDESRPFYPWMYRITRNLCMNHLSSSKNRIGCVEDEDLIPDRACGPEEQAIRKENLSDIERAISCLPEQHREILVLKHFQDCSYNDIAEILGIPIGTVMSRLYNARMKLKTILKEQEVVSNDL